MAGMRKINGKWYIRLYLPGGKEKLLGTGTANEKVAKAFKRRIEEREFLVKAKLVEDMNMSSTSLFDTIGEYLKDCSSRVKKRTLSNYELALRNLKDCWGNIDLSQISAAHFTGIREYFGSQVGPTTMKIRLIDIRTFLNWLVSTGKLERLPGKFIVPKPDEELAKFFTPEEIKKIFIHIIDPKMRAYIRILAETGLRRSEILGATFVNGFLHLHKTKGRRERLVELPDELHKDFHLAINNHYAPNSITRAFRVARIRAGIPRAGRSLHCLRYVRSSRILADG